MRYLEGSEGVVSFMVRSVVKLGNLHNYSSNSLIS